ncbi:tRNA-uridine aminocarboxypropyltransferase [Microbulbifer guangxiensis]|uniref:tRNA-uridine aminocarboxypropyltransferase n=1 Tax=Microbulbifer guangxiensis TaxID=2904249 RepID=UPI001F463E2E|nr:tRNA-uridine aminocarboxypropyltransferase [Microbulbifer guangxiensis]
MPRPTCPTCHRPLKVCYCSALVHIPNQIRVLIIQHPQEEKHPFNTGRIAHLCLDNCVLVIGEQFTKEDWAEMLTPGSALLYPSLSWLPDTDAGQSKAAKPRNVDQLVVIDATWRKSKKILHLNPALQALPRISLEGDLQSNYQVRRSSLPDSLSTVESIAMAMQQLEPQHDFQPLLRPFEKMIALQQGSAAGRDCGE